jgi:hypothetical protein
MVKVSTRERMVVKECEALGIEVLMGWLFYEY